MNDKFFKTNQKLLLDLVNTEEGRFLIGINKNDQVVKITPNSVHMLRDFVKDKPILEGKFYCYERMAKILLPILMQKEIAREIYKNESLYPYVYLTTTSFYAGAGDGVTGYDDFSLVWSTTHDAATGTTADASSATSPRFLGSYLISGDLKYSIFRSYYPTNTSSLGLGAEISAATLNVYTDPGDGTTNPNGVVVATTQASTTTLATSDYSLIGGTAYSDVVTASGTSYKVWTLNSTGRAAISLNGTTKMGLRNYTYDFLNSAPLLNAIWCTGNFSEQTGTANDPYFSITYIASSGFFNMY